jgi:hypothetical protein
MNPSNNKHTEATKMNTYIDTKELIPEILELGWIVKNDTWTDCPWSVYDQLRADYVAYLIETEAL